MTPLLGRARAVLTYVWPVVVLTMLAAAAAAAGSLGAESTDRVVVSMLINLILVVGLFVFMGISGVFSFGHAAFMAVGAYTTALLTIPSDLKPLLLPELPDFLARAELSTTAAIAVGGLAAGVMAAVLAFPLMRLSGLMAGLATFAVLIIINVVARNWREVTNGTTGMTAVPTTANATNVLVWVVASIAVAYAFQRSATGLRLRASREDEIAARASGIRVERERRLAFVVSAVIVGAGGGIYASFLGSFNSEAFFLDVTFITIAMLVIGGTKSLSGAVVGTIAVSALSELLRQVEQGFAVGSMTVSTPPGLREVGLALAMLAILLLRPTGITQGRELTWPLRDMSVRPAPDQPSDTGPARERRRIRTGLARRRAGAPARSKGADDMPPTSRRHR